MLKTEKSKHFSKTFTMKTIYFFALLPIMLLISLNSNAMLCIKNGVGEHFATGFEPCKYYWDKVVNDDGTAYNGPWGAIPPCRDKTSIANADANNQLSRQEVAAMLKNPSYKIILGSVIEQTPIEGSGYLVKYNGECIGFYKQKTAFCNYQESVKKKNNTAK